MGIVDYLEAHGVMVKYAKGGWQACKCPYHEDRTASASVNTTSGRFHCFACDIHEDVIGLIRRDTGMTYVEAKQKAEEEYGACPVGVAGKPDDGSLISHFKSNRPVNGRGFQAWRSGLT